MAESRSKRSGRGENLAERNKRLKADEKKYFGPSGRAVEKAHKAANEPPSLTLLVKLGSIAVHAGEMLSPTGHAFDRMVLEGLLADPDVGAWIKSMGALLPVKRG